MNDFTKDELKHILECVKEDCDRLFYKQFSDAVESKIQSMIDNYCEHECSHEWDGVLITKKPNIGKCKKCGQVCYIAIKDIE